MDLTRRELVLGAGALALGAGAADALAMPARDPVVVAGRAGGALKFPGVHVRSTTSENTSDVLLSCLQAVGTGLTSVGGGTAASSTPCAGILT